MSMNEETLRISNYSDSVGMISNLFFLMQLFHARVMHRSLRPARYLSYSRQGHPVLAYLCPVGQARQQMQHPRTAGSFPTAGITALLTAFSPHKHSLFTLYSCAAQIQGVVQRSLSCSKDSPLAVGHTDCSSQMPRYYSTNREYVLSLKTLSKKRRSQDLEKKKIIIITGISVFPMQLIPQQYICKATPCCIACACKKLMETNAWNEVSVGWCSRVYRAAGTHLMEKLCSRGPSTDVKNSEGLRAWNSMDCHFVRHRGLPFTWTKQLLRE